MRRLNGLNISTRVFSGVGIFTLLHLLISAVRLFSLVGLVHELVTGSAARGSGSAE
jgi:hypothetical protein